MGLLSGFCAMFVATILLLLPLVIVAIVLRTRAGQPLPQRVAPVLASVALLFAGVFTGCAPAWIHNRFVAHEPVLLSAHSGLNFWIGNNPAATGYPKIPPGLSASQEGLLRDSITLAEEEKGRKLQRWEVSEHWAAKAAKWRWENRGVWLRLMARKFSNFWNAFQYDDVSIISLLHSQGVLPAGLRFGMVAVFAIPGLVLGIVFVRRARWVAAAVLLHMAALMPVFITERYRLCAVPGLLLFAAFLLWQLWKWVETYRWSPAFATALAAFASAWFVSESRGDIGLWSLDHYNTGIRCLKSAEAHRRRHEPAREAQELDAARQELELAFAYVQDNAEINFALGNYWLARENRDKAKIFYRRTLELNPRHADCWNNVGYIALEEKRWDTAVKCFERALKYQPEDIKTSYLLARAYKEAGNIDAAKAALAPALQRLPHQPDFLALKAQLDAAPPRAPQ
jgi:tetratricopeptide (TPR) repeat protein